MAHNYSLRLKKIRRPYSIDTIYAFGSRGTELKMFAAGAGHIDLSNQNIFSNGSSGYREDEISLISKRLCPMGEANFSNFQNVLCVTAGARVP